MDSKLPRVFLELKQFLTDLSRRRQFEELLLTSGVQEIAEAFSVDSSSGCVVLVHYEGGGERDEEILWDL